MSAGEKQSNREHLFFSHEWSQYRHDDELKYIEIYVLNHILIVVNSDDKIGNMVTCDTTPAIPAIIIRSAN